LILAAAVLLLPLLACAGSGESAVQDAGPGDVTAHPNCLAQTVPVALDTSSGRLEATLELPARCPPHIVALFHAGSGPTDRNGNNPSLRNDSLKLLAETLAARGIASVRYDKRGVAGSVSAAPASQRDLRLSTYVEDARQWLDFLRSDLRFGRRVVVGHSEGSLIGMLAAEGQPVWFVSIAGAGRPAGAVLREQLATQLSGTLLTRANEIISELEAGREVASVPPDLAAVFHPSVQPYLIDWFRHDPAAIIRRLEHPPLIVQGTTDLQVGVADAELLRSARSDAKLVLIEGMNHVLRQVSGGIEAQIASYRDPTLPLHPALVEPIAEFIVKAR
jgi:uncharacterized protein